jgi:hypothetical protein
MKTPFDTDAGLWRLIRAAQKAPSVLNTQPWEFHIVADDRINLRAHPGRRLEYTDPRRRELFISCGAALFNLRMALRVTGHDPVVWLLPDPDNDPDLLASVEIILTRPHAPSPVEQSMYEMIRLRHTNRAPFSDTPVGLNIVAELEHVARRERTHLWLLHHRLAKRLLSQMDAADRVFNTDEHYLDELRRYTSARPSEFGIPDEAFGPKPAKGHPPFRDFGIGRPDDGRPPEKYEKHPRLLALTTDNDTELDWLRAGQGLQRVLLTAARRNVTASFYTQPLEFCDWKLCGWNDHATKEDGAKDGAAPRWPWPKNTQMIMRIGYLPVITRIGQVNKVASTPRDRHPDVLDMRTRPAVIRSPGRPPRPVPSARAEPGEPYPELRK